MPCQSQRQRRWKEPTYCSGAAGKDHVEQHFHMTPGSVHVPRADPQTAMPHQTEAHRTAEGTNQMSLHMERFALTTASLVASTPTSTSGVGRLGDGGRGAPKRRCEAVCIKESIPFVVGVGCRLRGTRGLGGRGGGCRGPRGVDRWLRAD